MSVGAAAVLVSIALVAQTSVTSEAAWNDREWDRARAGTVSCSAPVGSFASRGEGRALSGSLLGIDLDSLAAASGVRVTNNGARALHTPSGATPAAAPATEAWADPLNVTALSAVNANLGNGILKLPLNSSTGVLGQFGQAQTGGNAAGAAGYVTQTGGIGLAPTTGYPELATLSLSQLVGSISPGTAALLGNVSDVSLTVGAVTGRAAMNGCASAWASNAAGGVTREYLASSLRTEISSPTVGGLITGVAAQVTTLENTVNGLVGNTSVASGITSGLTTLLNGILAGPNGSSLLRLGSVQSSVVSATINLSSVRALLQNPFGDPGGVLTIDPAAGVIRIDTAALLQAAYPGSYGAGLNGLPPNTNLLADPNVLTALNSALAATLSSWIGQVNAALTAAIDAVQLNVSVRINLQVQALGLWVDIGHIAATTSGTLTALTTSAQTVLLPGLGPVVSGLISGILSPVLALLLSTVIGGLAGIVANTVNAVLSTLRALPTATVALTNPILAVVSNVYTQLYLTGVVAVTANAQNDPVTGHAEPADLASLPAGRYEVSAIRIGVLEAVAGGARLYLGRGSVGPGCSQAEVAAGGCAGY